MDRNQDAVLVSPASIPLYSRFRFGVYSLMPVYAYQYAKLGLFFIMPFVGIRIILVLRLSFAASKPDEILSLCTGDHEV